MPLNKLIIMASLISLWGGLTLAPNANAQTAKKQPPSSQEAPQPSAPAPIKLLLKCFLEQTSEPSKDPDPTVIFTVKYDVGEWSIVRSTQSGKSISRSETHIIRDTTRGQNLSWDGITPKLGYRMFGRLTAFGNGNYIYSERTSAANPTLYLCREQVTN